jgi:uncharacterized protein with PIN domain
MSEDRKTIPLAEQTETESQDLGDVSPAPRFVADGMLGNLAKWLRILGYDTDYVSSRDDNELVRIARAEGRILLTRDHQLAKRRGLQSLLIEHDALEAQLGQVIQALGLALDNPFTRCPVCNAPLEQITGEEAAPHVPPFVLRTQPVFRRCPICQRIFWRGTHWQRMKEALAKYRW